VGSSADYTSVTVTFTPNNKGGAATCGLAIPGVGTATAGCATAPVTLRIGGLWPNRDYPYTVFVSTAAGTASANAGQPTNQLRFTVICPNNSSGYCNNGVYAYKGPSQQGTAVNPPLAIGATALPICHLAGNQSIDARPWGAKDSDQWLRFNYYGNDVYFPFAWVSLDGGDNLGIVSPC
jgi:hypothetical protein